MRHPSSDSVFLAAVLSLGCAAASQPALAPAPTSTTSAGSQTVTAPAPPQQPTGLAGRTRGFEKRDGFIPIYVDEKTSKVYLEIPRDSMRALSSLSSPRGWGRIQSASIAPAADRRTSPSSFAPESAS